MTYVIESVGKIVDVFSLVIGEGFSTGRENTYNKYYYLMPYTF